MPMSLAENLQPFICGGVSACLGSTVIHPADLIKVRQQVATVKTNPIEMVQQILSTRGVLGLYDGLSTALVRQATYGTARIGLHRVFSDKLEERHLNKPLSFSEKAASGMLSGALAVCIGSPFDIALVRIQNDGALPLEQRRRYRNIANALVRISNEDGFRTLWRGLLPNVLRGMAMNVGMMSSYDQAKQMIVENVTRDVDVKRPSMKTQLLASAVAGFTCAIISLPFDTIKSRLMFQRANEVGVMPYRGVVDCFRQTVKKEGVSALWRGLPAYYIRCAPHAMVILLSIEQVTKFYRQWFHLDQGVTSPPRFDSGDMRTALRFNTSISLQMKPHDISTEEEGGKDDDEEDWD